MPRIQQILLVGHCGYDGSMLRHVVGKIAEGVPVHDATSSQELENAGPQTLVLINRQLTWGFGVDSGVELIRRLAAKPDAPAMMLVSNYEDAQQAAVEAGALPGFGKGALTSPATAERLRAVIRGNPADTPRVSPADAAKPV